MHIIGESFFPTWTSFFRNSNDCVIKLQRLEKSSCCEHFGQFIEKTLTHI
jgi:hypothetical protein